MGHKAHQTMINLGLENNADQSNHSLFQGFNEATDSNVT